MKAELGCITNGVFVPLHETEWDEREDLTFPPAEINMVVTHLRLFTPDGPKIVSLTPDAFTCRSSEQHS